MAVHHDRITDSLQVLSHFFVGEGTFQDTLQRVADLANEALEGSAACGLTMLVDGRPQTAVYTDELSPELDQAQYDTGIGPCLDAFRHKSIYKILDTEKDEQWSAFSAAAAARGIRSTMSMPLVGNNEGIGAMNFYSRELDAFVEAEETAAAFATQAAVVVANAQAYWNARTLVEQLNEAMKSRAVIEQAKGILMGVGGKTADESFQMLVRASQRQNKKLRDVAAKIVEDANQRRLGRA